MINKLHSLLKRPTPINNGRFNSLCPAHEDKSPSLSVAMLNDGRILIHCHAGCAPVEVMSAIGLSMTDLFPDGAIRDQMKGWAQTLNKGKSFEDKTDATVLAIAEAERKAGRRLNAKDLERERLAYMRMRHAHNHG